MPVGVHTRIWAAKELLPKFHEGSVRCIWATGKQHVSRYVRPVDKVSNMSRLAAAESEVKVGPKVKIEPSERVYSVPTSTSERNAAPGTGLQYPAHELIMAVPPYAYRLVRSETPSPRPPPSLPTIYESPRTEAERPAA